MPAFRKLNAFHWFTLLLVVVLLVPATLQDGMFMDGTQYACVSKNLANGKGSFWFPYLNLSWFKAGSSQFMEHPPLVYGIQSLFFKFLGDSLYTERIYSLVMAFLTCWLIQKIWLLEFSAENGKSTSWLPVMLWVIVPVGCWSYQNNMMENTMGVFTTAAIYFFLKDLKSNHRWNLLAGTWSIAAAMLCKGIPGLFPIVTYGCVWISKRSLPLSSMLMRTGSILAVLSVTFGLICLLDADAYQSLKFYLKNRLLQRIEEEPTVTHRFFILGELFLQSIPAVAILITLYFFVRKNLSTASPRSNAIAFLLIGCAGSFPLIFTPVQRGFYFVPALPPLAIGMAALVLPQAFELTKLWISKTQWHLFFKKVLMLSTLLIILYALYFKAGKPGRDTEKLHDASIIGKLVPNGTVIRCDPELYEDWALHFYLTRYHDISLEPAEKQQLYLLRYKSRPHPDSTAYPVKMNSSMNHLELFYKR